MRRWVGLVCVAVTVVGGGAASAAPEAESGKSGAALYMRNCAPCHGEEARGDGPSAVLFPTQPRNLREGFLDKYSTDDLVRRVRDGRPLPLALDIDALKRAAGEAGAIDRHIRKLPTLDWLTVERGWSIYAERCTLCHGQFGRSKGELPEGVRPPRDLGSAEFQTAVTDAQLVDAVRHGRKGMPALIPRLRVDEAATVAAFVRVLGPGFESYSTYCAQCHGDDGVGIGNFDSTVGAPAVTFDAAYFARVDAGKVRESIWHMLEREKPSMPHFRRDISESDARAVIEYLRTLPTE